MASTRRESLIQFRPVQRLRTAVRGVTPRVLAKRETHRHPHHRKTTAHRQLSIEGIQTDLLRLEGRMTHRLEHAFQLLEANSDTRLRHLAMVRRLAYATATLDIAVGPNPELNLFDMIAFLEISRNALRTYWIPREFGSDGEAVVAAFGESAGEAWKIAHKVISAEQRSDLNLFIVHWIELHPDRYAIETLRFSGFSEATREELPESDARGVERLVQHANRALTTADATRLLAERAFHYAQRSPFLMRLQARVATHELLDEGIRAVQSAPAIEKAPQILNQTIVNGTAFLRQAERTGIKWIATGVSLHFALRYLMSRLR